MNWKVVLAIITCNVVLMSASYTMLIPFLPLYLSRVLGAAPETLNLWTGGIFAITFAVCAIMAPIWGKMSDTRGKKLMMIRASFLIGVVYLLLAIVTSPLQLLAVRALQGFAAGLWPASLALMSAYSPKNKIGISMGVMQSANICGGIVGPFLGGTLAELFGMRASFFISAGTLFFITLVTLLFIKEPARTDVRPGTAQGHSVYRELLTNRAFVMVLIAAGMTNLVILLLQPIMTLYIGQLRGTEENLLMISGLIFSLSGISGAIASPIWGRTGQAKGFYLTQVASLVAAGTLIAAQFLPSTLTPFVILQFTVGLGFSGIFPSANAIAITVTSPEQRGTAFGLLFSAQQIGGTVGPLIGGLLATFIHLSYIFLLSGLILISLGIYIYFKAPLTVRSRIGASALHHAREKDFIELIKKQVSEEMRHHDTEDGVSQTASPFETEEAQGIRTRERIAKALERAHATENKPS